MFGIIIELMVIQVMIFVERLGNTKRQGIKLSKEAISVLIVKEGIVNKVVGDALVVGAHQDGDGRRQEPCNQVMSGLPE